MPTVDRLNLTRDGLEMPFVDHLSNNSMLNLILDRTIAGHIASGFGSDPVRVACSPTFVDSPTRHFANTTPSALSSWTSPTPDHASVEIIGSDQGMSLR
jgi:hypothetical protein